MSPLVVALLVLMLLNVGLCAAIFHRYIQRQAELTTAILLEARKNRAKEETTCVVRLSPSAPSSPLSRPYLWRA